MVFKASKNNVHSGNTLRASNSRYNRRYASHSFIVRRVEGHSDRFIDNFDITSSDVEFSLNKKDRWTLPSEIQEHIQSNYINEDLKTDLVVKHKLKRQANCIKFYSNKGRIREMVPRDGRHFDQRATTKFGTRRKRKGSDETLPDVNENEETCQAIVRYEVYVPCSSVSSIVHNPKYIKGEEKVGKVKYSQKNTKSRISVRDINEMVNPNNDNDTENDFYNEDAITEENVYGEFSLRDFVISKKTRKRRFRGKSTSSYSRVEPVRKLYYREPSVETEVYYGEPSVETEVIEPLLLEPQATPPRKLHEMHSATVLLSHTDTDIQTLKTTHGNLYKEARCFPRKFTIDITTKIQLMVKTKLYKTITSTALDLHGFLVFTKLRCHDVTSSFYNVCLNFNSNLETTKLETMLEMKTYSIPDIVSLSLAYISTIPQEAFLLKEVNYIFNKPVMNLELVNGTQNAHMKCIHPSQLADCAFDVDVDVDVVNVGETAKNVVTDMCNVCYESINNCDSSNASHEPATCLQVCGHWFCDQCWVKHLVSRLDSGSPKAFTCPGYDCLAQVDFHTLLSLLHITDIKKHTQRVESEKVNISDKARWCPILDCGNAIILNDTSDDWARPPGVVCSCGVDICFSCLQNAHWPATCLQASRFRKQVIAFKDYVDLPKDFFMVPLPDVLMIQGKNCPHCKRFIEKVDGCDNMNCFCGGIFCWSCGKATGSYEPHKCVFVDQNKVLFEEQNELTRGMVRTQYYDIAMEHRQKRLLNKTFISRAKLHSIAKRLINLAEHYEQVRKQVTYIPPNKSDETMKSNIYHFIMNMIGIQMELHHVIENTALAMEYSENAHKVSVHINSLKSHVKNIELVLNHKSLLDKDNIFSLIPKLIEIKKSACRTIKLISKLINKKSS